MPISQEIFDLIARNDPRVTNLDLSGSEINDNDVEALLKALAGNTTITTLDLSANQIGTVGARALAGNTTITSLDLSANQIGTVGARALAKNTTITYLDLSSNQIGDAGAMALAGNTTIIDLHLLNNQIGAAGAMALATNTMITSLDLSANQIGTVGVRELAKNTTITHLYLASSQIGDAGAIALAGNTTITRLYLSFNQIGAAGAIALAKNTTITHLDLAVNQIGDAGARALAKNTTITYLDLAANKIGTVGARALAKNTTITYLDLSHNLSEWFNPLETDPFILVGRAIEGNKTQANIAAQRLIAEISNAQTISKESLAGYLSRASSVRSEISFYLKRPDILKALDREISCIISYSLPLPLELNEQIIDTANLKEYAGILEIGRETLEAYRLGHDGAAAQGMRSTGHDIFLEKLKQQKTPSGQSWNEFSVEALSHVLIDYLSQASKFNAQGGNPLGTLEERLRLLHATSAMREDGKQRLGLQSHTNYDEIIQYVAGYFNMNNESGTADGITRFADRMKSVERFEKQASVPDRAPSPTDKASSLGTALFHQEGGDRV